MSDAELEDQLRQACGEAYGKGASAEDVVAALDEVSQRFQRLEEVDG